jgi:CRP-like cAMP-binding protein
VTGCGQALDTRPLRLAVFPLRICYLLDAMAQAFDHVDRILAFLTQFVSLGEAERQLIRRLMRIERYPKGTLLLAEGQVARENWLVVQGCVRVFRKVDGADRTVAFHTEFHSAIPPTYGTDTPSPVAFECLEDVVASASTREEEERGFAEYPAFESVCRVLGEILMARLQEVHVDVLTRTAEQRYLDLVARRPDLLQRVPQYHIASFLGIQPETLSRIRRRRVAGR